MYTRYHNILFNFSPAELSSCRDTSITIVTNKLSSIALNALTDDRNRDLLALGFTISGNPTNSSVSVDLLGTTNYNPSLNYSGSDSY
ncbi:MAG: hypothetical protein ACO3MG_04670 [Saprospiraceae bacterium]